MVRRAEWRRSPNDPVSLLGLLRQWPVELFEAQRHHDGILIAVFVPFWLTWLFLIPALPMVGGFLIGAFFGWVFGLVAFVGIIGFEFLVARLNRTVEIGKRRDRSSEPFSHLVPDPSPLPTFLVRVAIRYRGALIGSDVAIASFNEGWLYVEGGRMSCNLTRSDGQGTWRRNSLWIDFPDGSSLALRCVREAEHERFPIESFDRMARFWLAEEEMPEGQSIFPPISTHAAMRRGWAALTKAGLGLTVVSLVFLFRSNDFGDRLLLGFTFLSLWFFARSLFVRSRQKAADRHARSLEALPSPEIR